LESERYYSGSFSQQQVQQVQNIARETGREKSYKIENAFSKKGRGVERVKHINQGPIDISWEF